MANRLSDLKSRVSNLPHDYVSSTEIFLELNLKKIAKDLKLEVRGRERGERNAPNFDGNAYDDVENEVIEYIESEVKKAHSAFIADLSTYSDRLHSIDLEGYISKIESLAADAISSFRSEVSRGQNQLELASRPLAEYQQEFNNFRTENRLNRAAHYPAPFGKALRWSLIMVLFLAETIGSTSYLREASEYGVLGGFFEAFIITFLNLGVAMVVGFYGIRQIWHRAIWRKLCGFLSLLFWMAFSIPYNLLVAHYREASSAFIEGGGAFAVQALWANPFGLSDFQSWVLFGAGLLFSFIALVDALSMDDQYPNFGKIDRVLEEAREMYVQEINNLISDLEEIKKDAVNNMQSAREDLGKRLGERGSILSGFAWVQDAYNQHINYLQRAGNVLLSIYREANREARKHRVPPRFKEVWNISQPKVVNELPSQQTQKDMSDRVERAQSKLEKKVQQVYDEFEEAFKKYKKLTDFTKKIDEKSATSIS